MSSSVSGSEVVEGLAREVERLCGLRRPWVSRKWVIGHLERVRGWLLVERPEWGEVNTALVLDEVEKLREHNRELSSELAAAVADRIELRLDMAATRQACQAAWDVAALYGRKLRERADG